MAKRTKKAERFPGTLYAAREQDGDTSYLLTWESPEEVVSEDRRVVAVYRLEGIGHIESRFVSRKGSK